MREQPEHPPFVSRAVAAAQSRRAHRDLLESQRVATWILAPREGPRALGYDLAARMHNCKGGVQPFPCPLAMAIFRAPGLPPSTPGHAHIPICCLISPVASLTIYYAHFAA